MCRNLRTTTNLMTIAEVLGQTENDVKNMENRSVLREREKERELKNAKTVSVTRCYHGDTGATSDKMVNVVHFST